MIETPGIFFSSAFERKSNKPEALVPTIATFPSNKRGSIDSFITCHADTIFRFSDQEIKNYINKNQDKYKRDESRSLDYVAFFENATENDIKDIRESLIKLTEDRLEYNDVSKLTDTIVGFYNTKYLNDFINRYSDEEFDSIYLAKGKLPVK